MIELSEWFLSLEVCCIYIWKQNWDRLECMA